MKLPFARKFRTVALGGLFLMALLVIYLSTRSVQTISLESRSFPPPTTPKKAIEYGWNAPTPDFYAKHVKEMEQRPFDGIIMKLNAGKEVFKKTAYASTAFVQDRQDLAKTKSSRLTDNFIVMWSGMDKGWDWFSDADWAAAETNIRNFAKTTKAGRFRGIAFDSEPYISSTWHYSKQPDRQTKTFAVYQQQLRKRGAQFMNALQTEHPSAEVLTFGLLSWLKDVWSDAPQDATDLQSRLSEDKYGLWLAFVNGMLDVAKPNSVIIDGHEWAYYFSTADRFDNSRKQIFKDARILVDPVNRAKYDKHVKLGQAVFLDLLLDIFPNNVKVSPFAKTMPHFLSPEDRLRLLEHNVYHSLRTADRYSWLYDEHVDWWKNKIPKGAEAAVLRAKTKIQKGQPLGFDIAPAVKTAFNNCQDINQEC